VNSGHIAGIDLKDQLKRRSAFYERLLQERQTQEQKTRAEYAPREKESE
jgi:hypothetical protein